MIKKLFSHRTRILLIVALGFIICDSPAFAANNQPTALKMQKRIPRVPANKHRPAPLDGDTKITRVVIKFHEGTGVRLRSGKLTPGLIRSSFIVNGIQLSYTKLKNDMAEVENAARAHFLNLARLFTMSESRLTAMKEAGEHASNRQLADLNLYYELPVPPGTTMGRMAGLVDRLNTLDSVEIAYSEPEAEPAAITLPLAQSLVTAVTPDFTSEQGYLYEAPAGIDAVYAWTIPGGRGDNVRIVDVEGAWNVTHEDMPPLFYTNGVQINDIGWRNHGTAVLGEIVGMNNGYGVTGIAHNAKAGYASIGSQSTSSAIANAATAVGRGGVVLIELHRSGPPNSSPCTCNTLQCDFIALEYWQADYDAIATATANGVIVVEAAGNGSSALDDPVYGGAFIRSFRDSGAILVGASIGTDRIPACWTNSGSRVDVHGWGGYVTTMGYGNRYNGGTENMWYTGSFSGTSSASPIVVGSVASLQGMVLNATGVPLDAWSMRDLLSTTGSPQTGDLTRHIGPLPDLQKASQKLDRESNISISPISHDFASVPVWSTYAAQTYTITNTGTASLEIGVIAISGIDAADFILQNDACSGQAVAPAGNCTVDIVFSPQDGGDRTATLSIPSNDPDTPTLDVPLTGHGNWSIIVPIISNLL